jgi:hypothetical protein
MEVANTCLCNHGAEKVETKKGESERAETDQKGGDRQPRGSGCGHLGRKEEEKVVQSQRGSAKVDRLMVCAWSVAGATGAPSPLSSSRSKETIYPERKR